MLSGSGLRLGIALPQVFHDGRIDTDLIRDFSVRAEQAGYEDLWLTESILGTQMILEPLTLLSYAAACAPRIRLGVSVIILNQRNPVMLAKALCSVDQLSGGRLTAGVGLGGGTRLYPAFGISPERPVARFVEALRVVRLLMLDDRVTERGELWQLDDVAMQPKPVQKPHLPIWIGGHVPAALRRAVKLGDGWMGAGGSRNEDFFEEIKQIKRFIEDEGLDTDDFTLSKRVYLSVDRDADTAKQTLAAGLGGQYGNARRAQGVGIAGTPAQLVQQLIAMRDAGLQHMLLHPYGDPNQQFELLTREVAPEL